MTHNRLEIKPEGFGAVATVASRCDSDDGVNLMFFYTFVFGGNTFVVIVDVSVRKTKKTGSLVG